VRTDHRSSLSPAMAGRHLRQYGIVGHSHAVTDLIRRIELVSATRSTVLITGETGTGKELVARAVHDSSEQRNLPFIKVNCAAIPETLLESELFGYVRGAFTSATSNKRGKFSLANRGSIFLDEIGTMGIGLQAKLLRVLQEREIEPLGAERAVYVDVRVIAATNRDLRRLVEEGRFQDDLFYRLHVIPIHVPPLRERVEDIPMLVEHFAEKHATRNRKPIDAVEDGVVSLQFFYGFLSVAMAWQIAFLVIGSSPARFRPLMIPGIVEKFGHVVGVAVLYSQARISTTDAVAAGPDLLLGVLFIPAFAKTPAPALRRPPRTRGDAP
jgi:transcriptional regulator with GAF, ATPase, and Fis domain